MDLSDVGPAPGHNLEVADPELPEFSRAATPTTPRQETHHPLQRLIGHLVGDEAGATLVCVGGLHGNENAGVAALERVFETLDENSDELTQNLHGEFVGLRGNLEALAAGHRYLEADLNRHWHGDRVVASRAGALADSLVPEDRQLDELRRELESIFERARGPVFLIDFHTTSAKSVAFGTMADTLPNRAFALHFPAPIIVGLEEELKGTLTDYVCTLGHVAIGFEGGQHQATEAVDRIEAAIWIALEASGVLPKPIRQAATGRTLLNQVSSGLPRICETRYRHVVRPGDGFVMNLGYKSFDYVTEGETLAVDKHGDVLSPESGRILMPLYQKQGSDGFFLVRPFSPAWLRLSEVMRRLRVGRIAHWLPGVRKHPELEGSLLVDLKVARWFAVELFHLLGYVRHEVAKDQLVVTRRKFDFHHT